MSELKTLKDFDNFKELKENAGNINQELIWFTKGKKQTINDLKQEAVKWIKELETGITLEDPEDYIEADQRKHTINWIKSFFNIKEEDLKC